MLSVASLLNPVRSEQLSARMLSPSTSPCNLSSTHGSPQPKSHTLVKKPKMAKDGAVFIKNKVKGEINFPAYERLDKETMREVQRFNIYPLGKIQDYSRHIPYNSEKKNFLEKTGRESFEVFQYTFKVPGDDKEYLVMWDYNVGLVRITPFFKCCRYSKTTPAKMLNQNPGLKEITHSITGGSLAAQGYWMPYSCAFAICTTFCAHIAPALIPIFGPSFPSQCVPPEAPEHGRMIIDPSLIHAATAEAESYRIHYTPSPQSTRMSYSPHSNPVDRLLLPEMAMSIGRKMNLKRAFDGYGTESDDRDGSDDSSGDGYSCSPMTPVSQTQSHSHRGWRRGLHQNTMAQTSTSNAALSPPFKGSNPLLSAIPRSTGIDMPIGAEVWRAIASEKSIHDKECHGNQAACVITDKGMENEIGVGTTSWSRLGDEEKKAAWLLMQLSVTDEHKAYSTIDDGPRIKRVRATSL